MLAHKRCFVKGGGKIFLPFFEKTLYKWGKLCYVINSNYSY